MLRLNLNKVTNRDGASRAATTRRIGSVGRHVTTTLEIVALRKRSLSLSLSCFLSLAGRVSPGTLRRVESIGARFDLRNQFFTMLPHIIPRVSAVSNFFPDREPGIYHREKNAFPERWLRHRGDGRRDAKYACRC